MLRSRLRSLALCVIFLGLHGCAYHFRDSHNTLRDLGIQKIYVTSFRNLTYKPGIEQLFTTAMVREIARAKSFELVNSEKEADAVLTGEVTASESTVNASKEYQLDLRGDTQRRVYAATEYNASVTCKVELVDKDGRHVFGSTISDSKIHPGAGELGDAGATAPLINNSEHRLAVEFLATQMMASVYQRMIDTF